MEERVCRVDHSVDTTTALRKARVPKSQRLEHRHMCAACAYEAGYLDGMKSVQKLLQLAVADVEADRSRRR